MNQKTQGPTARVSAGSIAIAAILSMPVLSFSGQGTHAQHVMETITVNDTRGMRYCEILLVFEDRVDVYNTTASEGCPEDLWQTMDREAIAAAHGSVSAQLNGPKYWAMDSQSLEFGETGTFGGIDARYAATLPIETVSSGEGSEPYTIFTSSKHQTMVFGAGEPMYLLVDPEGQTYVLNAYGARVDGGDPANLVDQLTPPDGWMFEVVTPEDDLVVEASTDAPVQMVGDDLAQYYTLFEAQ